MIISSLFVSFMNYLVIHTDQAAYAPVSLRASNNDSSGDLLANKDRPKYVCRAMDMPRGQTVCTR